MNAEAPIAVFDSGVGGLTVARALNRSLPAEKLIYLGDTARVPYGSKSPATVRRFTAEGVEFLLHFRPKMLVIACNTASATALDHLATFVDVPTLGVIEPGARAAVGASDVRRLGVIGTRATVASGAYPRAIAALDENAEVHSRACPLFVPLVEEGWTAGPVVKAVAQDYLRPLLEKRVDVLILGCTHYPALKPVLQEVAGGGVTLVDSAEATATSVRETLAARGEENPPGAAPAPSFFVTDVVEDFERVAAVVWSDMPGAAERVELGPAAIG